MRAVWVAGVLAVVVAIAWGTDFDPTIDLRADSELKIVRESEPLDFSIDQPPLTPHSVDGAYSCVPPFTLAAYTIGGERLIFPVGHPDRPWPTVAPDQCAQDLAALTESGYRLAPVPSDYQFLDGIYTVDIGISLRAQCAVAAASVDHDVPCPGVVPTAVFGRPPRCVALVRSCFRTDTPYGEGVLFRDTSIASPPGVTSRAGPPVRLILSATPNSNPLVRCNAADDAPVMPIPGRGADTCTSLTPWDSPHSGLRTQRWRHNNVIAALSLSDAGIDLDLAREAIVDGIYWVAPDASEGPAR